MTAKVTHGYYDPDGDLEWFPNPLDSMPLATDKSTENYASRHKSTPDSEKGAEEVVTMHEKMYRMATKNGTTITMGGSENLLNSN